MALRGLVKEIDLGGLPAEDIAAFFSPDLDAEVGNLGIQLGGHPLFLQLVRSTAHAGVPQHALRDMRRFLEEEVYAVLPEPERRSLKLASLYRVPMPEVALLPGSEGPHDVILSLLNRSLLRPVGDGAFEAHDSIRAAFAEMMAPGERTQLGAFAAHQLLALAIGASTEKLPFGHHGGNHPVINLETNKVEITAHNHGFAVDPDSLKDSEVILTHRNLNDSTLEGLRHRTLPLFSVQYHPEASPGPHDSVYLFGKFVRMMEEFKE